MTNIPTGMDSSTNQTQIDWSKLPRKRDPNTGVILFQFDTPNGKQWLTTAPDTRVENVRTPFQTLLHFDAKIMGHEGTFVPSLGRTVYPEGSPTQKEIAQLKATPIEEILPLVELCRVQWGRIADDSQRMHDLRNWILDLKDDKETKDRILLKQRQVEAEASSNRFFRSLKNTFVCECGHAVHKDTVHIYVSGEEYTCPGCNKKIPKGEVL